MNDALVNIWIFAEKDGTIISAHCLGCKAGLGESCSHVASVMFYIEAVTRIQGKLACTQAKCTWILPTYVNEVPYAITCHHALSPCCIQTQGRRA